MHNILMEDQDKLLFSSNIFQIPLISINHQSGKPLESNISILFKTNLFPFPARVCQKKKKSSKKAKKKAKYSIFFLLAIKWKPSLNN